MLVSDAELRSDVYYMGPRNGCHHVLRCEAAGFEIAIDGRNQRRSMRAAVLKIDRLVFQAIVDGTYRFTPPERHEKAVACLGHSDRGLIDFMYDIDEFVAKLVKREMTHRGIRDDGIYQIGRFVRVGGKECPSYSNIKP